MLITPHVAVGAAIGVATGNPVLAFGAGIVSHWLLDAVPHTDPGTWHFYEDFSTHDLHAGDFTIGIIDAAVAIIGYAWLAGVAPIAAAAPIAGAIGGAFPDFIMLAGLFIPKVTKVKYLDKYFDFTEKYHRTARPNQWVLGIVTQLIAIALPVWYLLSV